MKKMNKSVALLLYAALLLLCLTGCKKACVVSDCRQDAYQDGLCEYHYELANYGQSVDQALNELGSFFGL